MTKVLKTVLVHSGIVEIINVRSLAAAAGGELDAQGHDAGDSAERQGLQAQQAADAARGASHRETRETAETRAGEKETPEAPGEYACTSL